VVLGSVHERSLENIAKIKFIYIQSIIYLIQEMAFGLYLLVSDEIYSILFQGKWEARRFIFYTDCLFSASSDGHVV